MNDSFLANDWWSLDHGFNINGEKDFNKWAEQSGQEKKDGVIKGVNVDPAFENNGTTTITDPHQLVSFFKYRLPAVSPLRSQGLDLQKEFSINPGDKDFNQNPIPGNGIGASF